MTINGSGAVTTSNPSTGGTGSDHTAEDVAALILAVPSTPINNTASGSIALVDTTTNLTNQSGGSGGDDAATIYNYFTGGSREDAFKASTAGLSTLDAGDVNSQVANALLSYNTAKASDVTSAKNEVVADIAALNDFDPSNDVVARVTLVDTTTDLTNGGSGGGGGDSASAIYAYFTDNNRELVFQADVSANALEATLNAGVQNIIDTGNAYWTTGSGGGGAGGSVTLKATPTPRAF
jgi:hypothetical protein